MAETKVTSKAKKHGVLFNWMVRKDVDEILAIEDKTLEWDGLSEKELAKMLKVAGNIGIVGREEGKVFGFVVYNLSKGAISILKLNGFDRKKSVEQLIGYITGKKLNDKRTELYWNVEENDLETQLSLKNLGFRAVKILKGDENTPTLYRFKYIRPIVTNEEAVS